MRENSKSQALEPQPGFLEESNILKHSASQSNYGGSAAITLPKAHGGDHVGYARVKSSRYESDGQARTQVRDN